MPRCKAELIFPAGQIDRCERKSHQDGGHISSYARGGWCYWFGDTGRSRAMEETQQGFKAGWAAAGRTDPVPIFELGPRFVGTPRNKDSHVRL